MHANISDTEKSIWQFDWKIYFICEFLSLFSLRVWPCVFWVYFLWVYVLWTKRKIRKIYTELQKRLRNLCEDRLKGRKVHPRISSWNSSDVVKILYAFAWCSVSYIGQNVLSPNKSWPKHSEPNDPPSNFIRVRVIPELGMHHFQKTLIMWWLTCQPSSWSSP